MTLRKRGGYCAYDPRELRIISALAVFLTAGLPAAAGAIAFRAQPVLVGAIIAETVNPVQGGFYGTGPTTSLLHHEITLEKL